MVLGSRAQPESFAQQVRFLAILALFLSLVSSLFNSRRVVAYCQTFRALLIGLTVVVLGGDHLIMEILLLMPFILESRNRRFLSREGITLALTLAFTISFDCLQLLHISILDGVIHSTVILAITGPTFLINSLLSSNQYSLAESRERTTRLGYAIENLSKVNKDLQDYAESSRSLSAEEERNRITRDMHDLVGYALTNVIMLMNATKAVLSDKPERSPEAMQMVEQTREQAENALQEARRILYQLRAVARNGPIGLQALAELLKVFSQTTHINVDFHYGNLPMSYGERIDQTIYQVVQEGLTNVVRHGKADRVTVSLWQTEEDILVSVRDNGAGAQKLYEGIGLKGMRERLSVLGGSVDAHAEPYGFVLRACIPARAASEARDGDIGSN